MKKLLIVLFYVFSFISSYCQVKKSRECWKVTDESTKLYFDNLFGSITGHDPHLALIKFDFINSGMIYIADIKVVRNYCKQKYNLAEIEVKRFTEQFIRDGKKIPLEDTLVLAKLDDQFNKYSFFADSVLDKYRVLGVRDFMIKYCDGGIIRDSGVPVTILAYLFENRIFWENMTGRISTFALKQIEECCKIKWDYKKKKWIVIK